MKTRRIFKVLLSSLTGVDIPDSYLQTAYPLRDTTRWKERRAPEAACMIELDIPLEIQVLTADERIDANRGRVAFRFGPMICNVEKADQSDISEETGAAPLTAERKPGML